MKLLIVLAVVPLLLNLTAIVMAALVFKKKLAPELSDIRNTSLNILNMLQLADQEICKLREESDETAAEFMENLRALLDRDTLTVEALRGIWTSLEILSKLDAGVDALLARKDASEAVKQLETLLKEAPDVLSSEDEARHSRAIEAGIANLLQYQVGKGGSSHDNGAAGF